MFGFKNGIHPEGNKSATENKEIEIMPAPEEVSIPLSQHIGAPCSCIVNIGDYVKEGQLIANSDKAMSSNIFSSISGMVTGFKNLPSAAGVMIQHVCIKNDFKGEKDFLTPLTSPSGQEILARIKEAGIVGMGGAAFPTHIKLSPPPSKTIDVLIINGSECEPYITCDYRLMIEKATEIAEGIRFIAKTLNVKDIYIGIEDNKSKAIQIFNEFTDISVIPLKTKYPQGAEKQLIYSVTGRTVPSGGLPMDVGCVVDNVHTAYSVYLAVVKGIPCYERVVTVSGGAAEKSGNYIIKTGTSYSYIAEYCGLKKEPAKIISGGPMMGFSVFDTNVVTAKATSSILFMTENEIAADEMQNCINCGKCARACPMLLMPMYIDSCVLLGNFKDAKKYGAADCTECGCCAYACPAKRPLVQSIRLAKKIIRQKNI